MTTDVSTIFHLDAVTDAAAQLAAALGLGDDLLAVGEWPVDPTDPVIRTTMRADQPFEIILAVDDDVRTRLVGDQTHLRDALGQAARSLLGEGAAFDIEQIEPMATIADHPEVVVAIQESGTVRAVVGVGRASSDTADDSLDGIDDGAMPFEPAALHGASDMAAVNAGSLELLNDVEMSVTVELGRTTMPIRELLALQPGMVVEIDRAAGSPIDILVNGRRIASGEVVVIDEQFGVRITDIAAVREPA